MIIFIFYLLFTFVIEGVSSLYISNSLINPSMFITIYTLIALIVIYPYFENKKKYLYILTIMGILFDIVYTNTFLINVVIFITIYFVNRLVDEILPDNIFIINIKSYLAVILYYSLTYIIIIITGYASYPIGMLFRLYYLCIMMSVIYTTISYVVIKYLTNKFDIKIK